MATTPAGRAQTQCLAIGLAAAAMAFGATAARAQDATDLHEVDTKYVFGHFTIGSSTEEQGDQGFESESGAGFGKRSGRYAAGETELEYEFSPTRYMQIELGPTISAYDIKSVPGLGDQSSVGVNGFEADVRSVLIGRGASPIAVTASLRPEYHSLDETSGVHVMNYGVEFRLEADAELMKDRLFFGTNLLYEPETTRNDLGWDRESTWGISSALAYQIVPKVVIGADLWYLQHYEGIGFSSFTGDAVYFGPTFYWQIAPKVLISAAWETQLAGRDIGAVPGSLDLTDFSRQRAHLLIEFEF